MIPISKSSSSKPLHEGSTVSRDEPLLLPGLEDTSGTGSRDGMVDCGIWILGADEDLWPCKRFPIPPKRLCDFPFVALPPTVPPPDPNDVALVLLLALFSRSSIFFLNCFASFSSTKDKPARQFSSSNEWKNVRS